MPSAPLPKPPPHDAERRRLTVMFVDLVGSTSVSEQADPEDLAAILEAYQKTCRLPDGILPRFEGGTATRDLVAAKSLLR